MMVEDSNAKVGNGPPSLADLLARYKRYLRYLSTVVFRPLGKLLALFNAWLRKYGSRRLGRTVFYGLPDFLDLCSKAGDLLLTEDTRLHEELMSNRFLFWFEPNFPVLLKRSFGISDTYVSYGEAGIISCMVYTLFETKILFEAPFSVIRNEDFYSVRRKINAHVRDWLEMHQYPGELIKYFDSKAR